MIPVILSQTGTGSSRPFQADYWFTPFNVGFGCVVSGTVTYTVQHTFDDIQNPNITPTWFNHPTVASLSANQDGNYAFQVAAIRLNVSAGSGTATLTIIQSGD